MKKFLLCLLCVPYILLSDNQYTLVDEYYSENKSQQTVFKKFSKIVSSHGEKIDIKQQKPVKIYMIYPGNQVSDYWRRSKSSFEARLNEIGIKYELVDYFTKPGVVEIREQAEALYEALRNDIDYLVFTLDAKKHLKFVNTILNKGTPKLILQNITTPLKSLNTNQPFLYDGFDHSIGAKLIADEYIKQVGKNGNYAVLYGSSGYVSHMRGDMFIKEIEKSSDLQLVASYYTDFNKKKAKAATLDLLKTHKNLKFVYACSTDIALGAIEALEEKNLLGIVKVNGWGGGSNELISIQESKMDFTVMRMNDDNGVAMAEAISLDLQKRTNEVPLIFSGDFELIKKGISSEKLNKMKQKAFRYSGI